MKPLREHLFPGDTGQIRCSRREVDGFEVPYHYHPEIEITLIEQGGGIMGAGDHTRRFGPFHLCMFGENLPHFYESNLRKSPAGFGPDLSVAEVVQFPPGVWDSWIQSDPGDTRELGFLFARAQRGLRFPEETARKLHPLFRELREPKGLPRLSAYLRLLEGLVAHGGTPMASLNFGMKKPEEFAGMHRARTILLSEYREPLSHREVAARLHLSPATFSRQFKRSTGMTFQEFLTRLRLGEAARLLIETDLGISQICYACGYGNLSNFNRQFKARRGRSPSGFRTHWQTRNPDSDTR